MRKMKMPLLLLLSVVTASALADGSSGEELYRVYCTQCHGISGDGNGVNSRHLNVQPRSHIDRGEMETRTDEELFTVIREGGQAVDKSILMPGWQGNLDEEEIDKLIAYLRVLCCED